MGVADRDETGDEEYWDAVVDSWQPTPAHRLWRAHSDAVNVGLLRRWLPRTAGRLLKTDLFDEAVGRGLYEELAAASEQVVGTDLSSAAVTRAVERRPGLEAHRGDLLALPFEDASFDTVVSNSSLDHFDRHEKLARSMAELARVTRPGGTLILTLDNRINPVVALRTSPRLARLARTLHLVPYFVGITAGAPGMRRLLDSVGFDVLEITAIMHCPPQMAAAWATRGDGSPSEEAHLGRVLRWEAMERWPTRHLTGHFVAARAVRQPKIRARTPG